MLLAMAEDSEDIYRFTGQIYKPDGARAIDQALCDAAADLNTAYQLRRGDIGMIGLQKSDVQGERSLPKKRSSQTLHLLNRNLTQKRRPNLAFTSLLRRFHFA